MPVVFLALGTRGDVQPLAALATALSRHASVIFISHAAHGFLLPPLRAAGVALVPLCSLPAAYWQGRRASLAAGREEALQRAAEAFLAPQSSPLLVCNLFALEAWHLGERLGVPVVVASPYVLPDTLPESLRAAVEDEPALLAQLHDATPGQLCWHSFELWQWPLFTQAWAATRERLRLPEQPELPRRATPLLYGFGEALVTRPGWWPASVVCTGAWLAGEAWETGGAAYQPPAELAAFLAAGPVLAVALGSMASLGPGLEDPPAFLHALRTACEAVGLRALVLVDAGSSLAAAQNAPGVVLCFPTSVPHAWLFPRCAAVLSHGGSGTVAAAAAAGVPQLVCPMMYDQPFWAARLEDLGVAPPPLPARLLRGNPEAISLLAAGLRTALSMAAAASALGAAVRAQDGVVVAVELLLHEAARGSAAEAAACAAELLAQPADAGVSVMQLPGGLTITCVSPEETVFLHREIYEEDCYRIASLGLQPGAFVLDVGANIGLFALRAAAAGARVVAVEPLPVTFAALVANTRHLGDAVRPVHAGVVASAARGDTASFTFFPRMAGNSTLHVPEKLALQGSHMAPAFWEGATTVECPVTTISAIMEAHVPPGARVALMKLDVEHSELSALQGVGNWASVDAVVVEVHTHGDRLAQVVTLLQERGFEVEEARATNAPNAVLVHACRCSLESQRGTCS